MKRRYIFMRKKFDKFNLVKVVGWVAVALGGITTSWAADKQMQMQNEEKIKEYIDEEKSKES